MPRWDGSEAASGWLTDSLRHAEAPFTPAQKRAQRKTRRADESFFRRHPNAGSYVRPYQRGEIAPEMFAGYAGEPEVIAVALACAPACGCGWPCSLVTPERRRDCSPSGRPKMLREMGR